MRFDVLVVWSFVCVLLFGVAFAFPREDSALMPKTETSQLLALTGYFSESVNLAELRRTYEHYISDMVFVGSVEAAPERIKVLIVPGHDDEHVGARFGDIREVDLTRELAAQLAALLEQNNAFEVFLAATTNGWHPELAMYFATEHEAIVAFEDAHKEATQKLEPVLTVTGNEDVLHNEAAATVAHMLYGINKFANDKQFDIVLHIHFNDYPGRPKKKAGKYKGFSIYAPAAQLSNGRASQGLARHLLASLREVRQVSNLPIESAGIIESAELIAVGAYNTANPVSLLVEYGFVYEPDIVDSTLRTETFAELAQATAQAFHRFLITKQ